MGEGIYEATIVEVLKREGEHTQEDEPFFEVATDKIVTEISSTAAGTVAEVLAQKGDVVQVGQLLAKVQTTEAHPTPPQAVKDTTRTPEALQEKKIDVRPSHNEPEPTTTPNGFLSPLVRSIIKKEHISPAALNAIKGTGLKGRITKRDLLAHLSYRESGQTRKMPSEQRDESERDILEMTHLRKIIASNMLDSVRKAPHVTSVVEADMSEVVGWMQKNKSDILQGYGVKVTYTPIIIHCIIKALFDFPMMNISVDQEKIIKWHRINIGIATALLDGNLIVPVIKSADKLSFLELTKSVNSLASRARESKLLPEEIQGGTYTFSNIGVFGNLIGTPIIHQPQAAILAAGVIQKKPAVIETPQGDFIGIRHKMYLSHTFDHRVIDGSLGGKFAKRVAEYLESFKGIDV